MDDSLSSPPSSPPTHPIHRVPPLQLQEFLEQNNLTKPQTVEELEKIVHFCSRKSRKRREGEEGKTMGGLQHAIYMFERSLETPFLSKTLPQIIQWATSPTQLSHLPLLLSPSPPPSSPSLLSFSYSFSEARSFLANVFLCNVNDVVEGGGMWGGGFWGRSLDFYSLYMEVGCGVGEARIECMMAYFEREFMESCGEKGDEKKEDEKKEDEKKEDEKKEDEKKEDEEKDKGEEGLSSSPFDPNRLISFERFIHPPSTFPKWGEMKEIIKTDKVVIHTEGMEVCEADAFVDFANQDIHIHRIIPSATQEEVLFSCCPEAFISILLFDRIRPNEAVVIRNCRRYAEYRGYLYTFQFTRLYPPTKQPAIQDIVVIDALPRAQYNPTLRDINKCYLGFQKAMKGENYSISTGGWGCGAFGGDEHYKFVEQIIVASFLSIPLSYSSFHNDQRAREFKEILHKMEGKEVGEVVGLVLGYGGGESFRQYINRELGGVGGGVGGGLREFLGV